MNGVHCSWKDWGSGNMMLGLASLPGQGLAGWGEVSLLAAGMYLTVWTVGGKSGAFDGAPGAAAESIDWEGEGICSERQAGGKEKWQSGHECQTPGWCSPGGKAAGKAGEGQAEFLRAD